MEKTGYKTNNRARTISTVAAIQKVSVMEFQSQVQN
ncbi:hypothetical protein HP15_2278 [Marinobacter adhaerens HP15]|uniref:Uncharacterized protein n=1 Tax=Marinobacter adhaerens (strain DSM 23420 / HP15) TaxID=225937 RepID=E4PFX2_MARAH|nr:hypothetical protein HP15_2278 [Marinobacter adhaerens HP15]